MEDDPRPIAIPRPLRTSPRTTNVQTEDAGDPVQDVESAGAPQNFKAFATPDNGVGTNAAYDFYTVPAGKVFIVTSCTCAENTTNASNIQFVALKEIGGVGKVANAYLYGGERREIVTSPIPFAAGTTVRLSTGGAVTSTIAQVQGYLVSPSIAPTAPQPEQTQIKTPHKK